MDEEKRRAYSEVVEVLKLIEDEEKMEKIPFEVIQLIKNNSDPKYKPNISKEIPIENQNLSEQAYAVLAWIANKYWGEQVVEEKKQEIRNAAVYNDLEREILERVDNIENEYNLPIAISNLSLYERIAIKIINFFKSMLKINKSFHKDREREN